MILKQIIICFSFVLLLSCERSNTINGIIENVPHIEEIVSIDSSEVARTLIVSEELIYLGNIVLTEFNPTHFLLTWYDIFEHPNLESRLLREPRFNIGTTVQILKYGEFESINAENRQWIKIRNHDQIIWSFTCVVREFCEYKPMNAIDIEYLFFENFGKDNRFRIEGNEGAFFGSYGLNEIRIFFMGRHEYFGKNYRFQYEFRRIEYAITNNSRQIPVPGWSWASHGIKNVKNGITFVDSFVFAVAEAQSQRIERSIFFTTNNYDIRISIALPGDSLSNEMIRQIMNEAPKYFSVNWEREFDGEDPREYNIVWLLGRENNTLSAFGNNLRNGVHQSQMLNYWYAETGRLLNRLRIK